MIPLPMNPRLVLVAVFLFAASSARARVVDTDAEPPEVLILGQAETFGLWRINLGWQAATGDFNGDGYMDVATAGHFAGRRPTIVVFFGRSGLRGEIDLSLAAADVTIREIPAFRVNTSCLGSAPRPDPADVLSPQLAGGDLTGDGIDDLVIGGPCWSDALRADVGLACILPGRTAWPAEVEVDPDTCATAVVGELEGGRLGERVAVADIDGDGQQDLIAAATEARGSGGASGIPGVGRIYMFRGPLAEGRRLGVSMADGVLIGSPEDRRTGRSLALGDLDSVAGAEAALGLPLAVRGRVVLLGCELVGTHELPDAPCVAGEIQSFGRDYDGFGTVTAIGDVDCSGWGDVAVTTPFSAGHDMPRPYAAEVRLFADVLDRSAGTPPTLTVFGRPLLIPLRNAYPQFAEVLLDDLNGDGFDDLIIGAWVSEGLDGDVQLRGEVDVIWSRPDLPELLDLVADSEFVLSILGPRQGSVFGRRITTGDVNGDGALDLVVGSTTWETRMGQLESDGAVSIFTRDLQPTSAIAEAGPDQVVAADGTSCFARVTLDASGSSDSLSHPLRCRWYEGRTFLAEGERATVSLPLGEHCVRLLVEGDGGWDQDKLHVTVRDETAPVVRAIVASPSILWPPNHRMVDVSVDLDVFDACAAASELVIRLVSVTSSEADDDRGDGNHAPDIEGFEVGSADFTGRLRAERSGRNLGRTYELSYSITDPSGNVAIATARVEVVHDRRSSGARTARAPVRR